MFVFFSKIESKTVTFMNMLDLPLDIILEIFSHTSSYTRAHVSSVSKQWYNHIIKASSTLSPFGKLYYDCYSIDHIHKGVNNLYKSGDYHLIVRLKKKKVHTEYICMGGNMNVVTMMLSLKLIDINSDDLNFCLYGACRRGHLELAQLMLSLGAVDTNRGLYGACKNGNLELAKLMLDHGAHDIACGLYGACYAGNIKLIDLMISQGANAWNWGLYGACRNGDINLVNMIISYGATNWNNGLRGACKKNNNHLFSVLKSLGATRCDYCRKPLEIHV